MEIKKKPCKFCGNFFLSRPKKGAEQEYCSPTHRRYENMYQWLRKKKAAAQSRTQKREEQPLDAAAKKKISDAVKLTVRQYGETLRRLSND